MNDSAGSRNRTIDVDAGLVAGHLGLAVAEFKQLMERRQITLLCERGVAEDVGTYRASFYYARRKVRLVLDHAGRVLSVTT
ncbi:DUF6522 family protein [Lysobacter sp. LF1]|uniref:DUF6522 family protein n=1 Tax=Lysobacter stagni TaxID=3045172 RepID=A0ABT6XK25_9GAMM|nr:DUF6522 family protein [Lysobacter sp. LF1]MDI9240095.1 DUF6522 family protein [Lysobacter sp. LF1]